MATKKRPTDGVIDLETVRRARRAVLTMNAIEERLEHDAARLIAERHPAVAAPLLERVVVELMKDRDSEAAYELAHAAAELMRFYRDVDRSMNGPTGVLTAGVRARVLSPLKRKRDDV